MKFLITNTVPLNGGDETLLHATIDALRHRWPDADIAVLCKDVDLCHKHLADLNLAPDLEFAAGPVERRAALELYQQADLVLSAPGGFLHDYYSIEERLKGFEVAMDFGKPVVLFAQSIGPFWKPESLARIPQVLNRVSRIIVRDRASTNYLLQCGVHPSKIHEGADAAFLWRDLNQEFFRPDPRPKKIAGLCFRVWPLGDSVTAKETVAKAERLCRHILSDPDWEILLISTCQGIPGYVDDSLLAIQIVEALPKDLRIRCRIDRKRYRPRDLLRIIGNCEAFIGMRLHACILAMIAGVPAAGLGYEHKTEEIFRQLGLERYQTRFEKDGTNWIECAERLLADVELVRAQLPNALNRVCAQAKSGLDIVEAELSKVKSKESPTAQQRWSRTVSAYSLPHLRLRQVASLVTGLAPKRMLDLGCAEGHLHKLCPGIEYVGCDFVLPRTPVDFLFYPCDFNRDNLPHELTGFELVVCSGLLEYIENVPAFLADIRSRLIPSGHLVATYFNMNHISRVTDLLRGSSFAVHPTWRNFYSPADIRTVIEKGGFRITKSFAMNHSLGKAAPVDRTVSIPFSILNARPWSRWLAHQLLFVAQNSNPTGATSWVQQILDTVSPGCRFILVDEDQLRYEFAIDPLPFPFLEHDGQYWGPPADSETAIRELERMRQSGAELIVFTPPAFWWLGHYSGFDSYLRSRFRCTLQSDRLIVFDLRDSNVVVSGGKGDS